ncbi:hypothetical protein GYMLUDRAFT_244530 [Collybiopsis luxurians FD-317 M1]|uniref:Hydrophobin n=1 Tax=Collybiopsis luxurians FD-317 M1 TaxID=944289 RepID=A0A0D0CNZ5_9AGAR|nr:hypothetical protein GYMLUDRAFT_244530 [Collybiopsis luxurians FD-317 M1]
MQFKLAFVTAALAGLAVATPAPRDTCSTGPVQCCNSVTSASNPLTSTLLGLLGIVLGNLNVDVGILCSPLSVVGINGQCQTQAVCCEDNSNSLVSIGCLPIQL